MIKILNKTDLETCIYRVRNAGDKERSDDKYNKASVLVLFINDYIKKNSSILMIKRRDNLRKHPGQIAFPGGRKEKEDLNLEETAKRETEEEINLSREHFSIVGNFPKFFTGTGYVVTPFLGIIKSNSNWQKLLKPNLSEVEKIFFPPTECLLSPKYHLREKPPINSSMSRTWAINYNDKNIWGLTARVLVTISAGLGLREFPPCDDI
jgi:8-oxo-dGTP pyrophosphatase MutT (NUDIX family)